MTGDVTLIVYGTLLTGECNHFYCEKASQIIPCTIQGRIYDTGLGYPAFVPGEGIAVAAEAVTIPETFWPAIDELEDYPVEYDRRIIEAETHDGEKISGWVYIMNLLPPDSVEIKSGNWKLR